MPGAPVSGVPGPAAPVSGGPAGRGPVPPGPPPARPQNPVARGAEYGHPIEEDDDEEPVPASEQERQRARLAVVAAVVVLLLVLPLTLLLWQNAGNPLGGQLDELSVPKTVDLHHSDASGNSRYCVHSCAWLKRIYQSGEPADRTDAMFKAALRTHGWQPADAKCPKPADGGYSCWQRDQYVLDLWVRPAGCGNSAYQPLPVPSETKPPAEGDVPPTAAPAPSGPATAQCPAAQASLQVANVADPDWRARH
jgi:hypothetical protein